MAQQVEHVLGKDGVTGSNPVSSSKEAVHLGGFFIAFWGKNDRILGFSNHKILAIFCVPIMLYSCAYFLTSKSGFLAASNAVNF